MMDITSMNQCLDAANVSPTICFRNQNTLRKSQLKIYEQGIDTLSTFITELQTQNQYLKKQLLEYPRHCSSNMENHMCASINQLVFDVTALKSKLIEVQNMKDSLEKNYKEVVRDYHCTVMEQFTVLKHELQETQLKNEALDNNISVISKKLKEVIHGKDKQIKETERQWMDQVKTVSEQFDAFAREKNKELHMKQEFLEKKDLEDIERKEEIELLTNKIYDLEIKLEKKIQDEEKLQTTLVEQHAMMKEEFNKLRNEIDHETQKQNQNLISKVCVLKKAIGKLEKSKEKLENDYEKKIIHVVKNKDLEIRALQLRLQEQKHELCTSLNTIKESEVDNIVTILEKRYKTLLAETKAATETQNLEYLRKIAELEDELLNTKKS
ncbi:uncharacterized protein LOC143143414 isoform X2 [Ptiloglossa arizonensis]|uniref:uncharacterized protein LOC143143414 isoform X2 n=1 Tax=Ptiloglossa arizonensis TaxID=3350558 RepID=UPI003FA0EC46